MFSSFCAQPLPLEAKLTLPKLISCDMIQLVDADKCPSDVEERTLQLSELPFAVSSPFQATATLTEKISRPDGKEVLCLNLEAPRISELCYEPGDTIGILTENNDDVVSQVLTQIARLSDADRPIKVTSLDPKKKYLPCASTLRQLFKKHINFKGIPLKQHLVVLAEHTSNKTEKKQLESLASREHSDAYRKYILEAGTDFFTVLTSFSTCCPPAAALVQLLPRLLPRPYSIASSPASSPSVIRVAFSVLPGKDEGLCGGMVRRAFAKVDHPIFDFYLRKSHGFRLPEDDGAALVLVGPGTGVSPFVGFLDHLKHKNAKRKIYLFTGFQRKDEFVYRRELEQHVENGLLSKLLVCYSRDEDHPGPRYVQDSIKEEWKNVGQAMVEENGLIYVCGNFGQKMAGTVELAVTHVIEKYLGTDHEEASKIFKTILSEKRYLKDIWY